MNRIYLTTCFFIKPNEKKEKSKSCLKKMNLNYFVKKNMKKYLSLFIVLFALGLQYNYAQNYNQSVKDFVEGKYYKNQETGRSIKYGYISSLNTYGLTFKDSEGRLAYFMNCSVELSSDQQYMELTYCMSPATGGTLGKFGVYKDRIVMYGNDGTLRFYPEKEASYNSSETSSGNSNSEYNVIGKAKKIGALMIAQFDFPEKMTKAETLDALENLGDGWRLPTKIEASLLFKNKSIIGGFSSEEYWITNDQSTFYKQDFKKGTQTEFIAFLEGTSSKYKVRAVKKATK
jgi:hypothetical protein